MSKNITKEQAIEIADAHLRDGEKSSSEWFAEMYKTGKHERNMYVEFRYTLHKVVESENNWFLTYWWKDANGNLVDPSFAHVSVDKITGEANFLSAF
jgi:hypothetical protein